VTATSTVLTDGPTPKAPRTPVPRPMAAAFLVVTVFVVSGAYLLLTRNDAPLPTRPTLSHAQLVGKAQVICTAMDSQTAALGTTAEGASPAQVADLLDKQAAVAGRAAVKLKALVPPAEDLTEWTTALTRVDHVLAQSMAASAVLRKLGGPAATTALAQLAAENKAADAAFTQLGMPACAS
jgi:hypothetical protein